MKAEIIAVGTEILLGQIDNTNTTFLAEELAGLGIEVYYQSVVGDNPKRLEEALELADQRSDLTVLCGGLG
ncbi:MAG: molybdopterin-binding protein, partial [Tetragenococcus halophilus]|nr:molybdopterin-binding protein [Tetragenococcus halophilus]